MNNSFMSPSNCIGICSKIESDKNAIKIRWNIYI